MFVVRRYRICVYQGRVRTMVYVYKREPRTHVTVHSPTMAYIVRTLYYHLYHLVPPESTVMKYLLLQVSGRLITRRVKVKQFYVLLNKEADRTLITFTFPSVLSEVKHKQFRISQFRDKTFISKDIFFVVENFLFVSTCIR